MKKIAFVFIFLLASLHNYTASSQPKPQKQRSWYQSFRIADYLPDFIGKRITQWRIKRMFEGTRSAIDQLIKEYRSWKEGDIDKFVNNYFTWIDQFYDIIGEVIFYSYIDGKIIFYTKEEGERLKNDPKERKTIGDISRLWDLIFWSKYDQWGATIREKLRQIPGKIRKMQNEQLLPNFFQWVSPSPLI